MAYNRYSQLKVTDGIVQQMPFVKIKELSTDKYITWKLNSDRYEILSDTYYGNPIYDFLLNYGNPQIMSEFEIEDGATIRIPFPLDIVLKNYNEEVNRLINQ